MVSLLLASVLSAAPGAITLPGSPPIAMDYIAYDPATHRVWVPAGNSGNVDVIDTVTGKVTPLAFFATAPSPRAGRPPMGPSSAYIGDGVVWVGNRADRKLCAIDARTLRRGACVELPGMPDGVAWVPVTKEVWVTAPREGQLTIVSAKSDAPVVVGSIKLQGAPEGFAVDDANGIFYTNYEDKDQTVAIDARTRRILSTWATGCGENGPRGLALDAARKLLVVACTDGAVTLDLAHDGKRVGRLRTGAGVDNLDYDAVAKRLYVASAQDGTLTVAILGDDGSLTEHSKTPTAKGGRNAVCDREGTVYVPDSQLGRLIVVRPR